MSTNPTGGYEVTVLEHQLRRQLNLTILIALVAIAALLWTLSQSLASSRREQRMSHIAAVIDSLDHVADLQRRQIPPLEHQVESFGTLRGQFEAQIRTKADISDVRDLSTRVAALGARLERSDSLISDLHTQLVRGDEALHAAAADSMATLRDTLRSRVATLREADRDESLRNEALDTRVSSLEHSGLDARKWTAVRDAATVTGLGMITAHIIGGR